MRGCVNDLDSLQESLLENCSYACVNTSYRKNTSIGDCQCLSQHFWDMKRLCCPLTFN